MNAQAPTQQEIDAASNDLIYAALQSAIYFDWCSMPGPPGRDTTFEGAVKESSLMMIRKTREFFGKPSTDKRYADNLYAETYGWATQRQWTSDLREELNKRAGHITARQQQLGVQDWPFEEMTREAVDEWIAFFRHLLNRPSYAGTLHLDKIRSAIRSLETTVANYEQFKRAGSVGLRFQSFITPITSTTAVLSPPRPQSQ